MQVSAKEMLIVIIGRRSVFLGAGSSAYPQKYCRSEESRCDWTLQAAKLLRDADTASIYSLWHLMCSKLSFMHAYVHLTCLPPEQWMNT